MKERKVSSALVRALEKVPQIVQAFVHGSKSRTTAPLSSSQYDLSGPDDPLMILLLGDALEICALPVVKHSDNGNTDGEEISGETEKLISTAKLILKFRQSLEKFDIDAFKSLLDESKRMQERGLLSSNYGVHELSVYQSSSMAISIARDKLVSCLTQGQISGSLDAVNRRSVEISSLAYWTQTCRTLINAVSGIIGGLSEILTEAALILQLREAVIADDWNLIKMLLNQGSLELNSHNNSISFAERNHVKMICKFEDSISKLTSILSEVTEVMDSTLVIKIRPLEETMKCLDEVFSYNSELLPVGSDGQYRILSILDAESRRNYKIGVSVLSLWKAVRFNNWNVEPIASSNLHNFDRPHDLLLASLFDSIRHWAFMILNHDETSEVQFSKLSIILP